MVACTVYDAGDCIEGMSSMKDDKDQAALVKRHAQIVKGKTFQKMFPNYDVQEVLRNSKSGSFADRRGGRITIHLGGNRSEVVLLHEMAHHLSKTHAKYGNDWGHGYGFNTAFLDVVRLVMGLPAYRVLRKAYREMSIKVLDDAGKPVKVRDITLEPELQERVDRVMGVRERAAAFRAEKRDQLKRAAKLVLGRTEARCAIDGCDAQVIAVAREYRWQGNVQISGTCPAHGEVFYAYGTMSEWEKLKRAV